MLTQEVKEKLKKINFALFYSECLYLRV